MNCQVCLENFDGDIHRPFSISPCGHTFCITCLNFLPEKCCPKCRRNINEIMPNYAILDVLDLKLFNLLKQNEKILLRKSVNNYGFIEWKMEDKPKIIAKLIDGKYFNIGI
jgi:hypothetical protein